MSPAAERIGAPKRRSRTPALQERWPFGNIADGGYAVAFDKASLYRLRQVLAHCTICQVKCTPRPGCLFICALG
jgi:hypothetical protein